MADHRRQCIGEQHRPDFGNGWTSFRNRGGKDGSTLGACRIEPTKMNIALRNAAKSRYVRGIQKQLIGSDHGQIIEVFKKDIETYYNVPCLQGRLCIVCPKAVAIPPVVIIQDLDPQKIPKEAVQYFACDCVNQIKTDSAVAASGLSGPWCSATIFRCPVIKAVCRIRLSIWF